MDKTNQEQAVRVILDALDAEGFIVAEGTQTEAESEAAAAKAGGMNEKACIVPVLSFLGCVIVEPVALYFALNGRPFGIGDAVSLCVYSILFGSYVGSSLTLSYMERRRAA